MPEYTKAIAAALDAKRKISLGTSATLVLLNHTQAPARGYESLATVSAGWHFKAGDIGGSWVLQIAESQTVTEDLLNQTVAFSIDNVVWKIVDNEYSSPTGLARRVWRFHIKRSTETFGA